MSERKDGMKATARFCTTLRVWRDYGANHMQATLSLAGLALEGIQVDIRGGVVTGLAVIGGEVLDDMALAEVLTERCRLDKVQVIVQPLSHSPHEPHPSPGAEEQRLPHSVERGLVGAEPAADVGRGVRGRRKAIRE